MIPRARPSSQGPKMSMHVKFGFPDPNRFESYLKFAVPTDWRDPIILMLMLIRYGGSSVPPL